MRKLNTKLMNESIRYQIDFRIRQIIDFFGREKVFQEFRGDNSPEILMLEVASENLFGTYGIYAVNESVDFIFETELKKVG